MDLNIDDELITKYYDLEEERRKEHEAIMERITREKLEEATNKGIKKNQKDVVLNMYKENFSIEIISKATNLTIDEIKNIIDKES